MASNENPDPAALAAFIASLPPPQMSRKIHCEIVLLLGWGPAILMQLAHPLVAAAVAEHSTFNATPDLALRRLWSTVDTMLALTFGAPEEVALAADRINRIHDRVHGHLREAAGDLPAGTPYSAHDPDLLRWVHATLMVTMPRAYELYVGPLTEEELDRYYMDASRIAPLLGMPDDYPPRSAAELSRYMDDMLASGRIAVTEAARGLMRSILSPPHPRPARPLIRLLQLPTVGLLPPSIRAAYGLPWERRHEIALRGSVEVTRRLVRLSPRLLRHWPAARAIERAA